MTTQSQILQYLNSLHPAVSYSMLHVNHIMHIIQHVPEQSAYVKLYRYNGMKDGYDFIRTIPSTDDAIKQAIVKALDNTQPKGGYMYECYNSSQQSEGKIYSLNPELF